MNPQKEMIFVFTGPDGSGRKTVADMVGTTLGLKKVLSYTTRAPRAGEADGQDYHFISRIQFENARAKGEFIESVEINGNLYGIKQADIDQLFEENEFIYLILNADGAKALKEVYGETVTRIFIYVDSNTIVERQRALGASEEIVQSHINRYAQDMAYMPECRHSVENIDLAHTVFAVTNILEEYMNRDLVDKD